MARGDAKFDLIEAAGYGYSNVWAERKPLLQLAFLPFLIKLGSYALILFLGMENQYLRHGLILIPSFFAEGFLLSYVICCVMRGMDLRGNFDQGRAYAKDIMAGMIIYVMIQVGLAFFVGSFVQGMQVYQEAGVSPEAQEPSFLAFLSSLVFLAGMIWAFRILWLYVPVAMGVPARAFLVRIYRFSSSFYMLGCWLLCFVPFGIVMVLVSGVLEDIFPAQGEQASQAFHLSFAIVQSAFELIIALVSSFAMAYAVRQIMDGKG